MCPRKEWSQRAAAFSSPQIVVDALGGSLLQAQHWGQQDGALELLALKQTTQAAATATSADADPEEGADSPSHKLDGGFHVQYGMLAMART